MGQVGYVEEPKSFEDMASQEEVVNVVVAPEDTIQNEEEDLDPLDEEEFDNEEE